MTLVDLMKEGFTEREAIGILKNTYRTIENEWIITARHIVNMSNTPKDETTEERE